MFKSETVRTHMTFITQKTLKTYSLGKYKCSLQQASATYISSQRKQVFNRISQT